MNKNQLVTLLEELYPASMINQADRDRSKCYKHAVKANWLIPTKQYMAEPIVLHMFNRDFTVMSNPTMNFADAFQALDDNTSEMQNLVEVKQEVQQSNTNLDKSFYTPDYFKHAASCIKQNRKHILAFQKTLQHADDVYMIFSSDLTTKKLRKPLTKDIVKFTVASAVYAKQFSAKHSMPLIDSGKAVPKLVKANPKYAPVANKFYKMAAFA